MRHSRVVVASGGGGNASMVVEGEGLPLLGGHRWLRMLLIALWVERSAIVVVIH